MAPALDCVRAAFSVRRNIARIFVPPKGHLRPLDGIRAFSVIWVVVFHAGWYSRFFLPPGRWFELVRAPWMLFIWRGDFGVDIFFVLSGFLIAGMLLDEHVKTGRLALGLFYVRRLMRLWPALLLVVGFDLLSGDPKRHAAWQNALYINNFFPVGTGALGWTWSLAIEEQFYLVCPWVLQAVFPFRARGRVAVMTTLMMTLIFAGTLVIYAYRIHAPDIEIVGNLNMGRWALGFDVCYDKLWMRAGALLAGVTSAILYRTPQVMDVIARGKWITAAGVVIAVAAMALATHWQLVEHESRGTEVAFLASFRTVFGVAMAYILLVSVSAHPFGRAFARPLSSRWLFPFSQLAYSAYLVNPIVTVNIDYLMRRFVAHGEEPMLILAPVNFVGTFLCAAVINVFIERPGMELRPR